MLWHDLAKALCLVLIIEGIIPFLNPSKWRRLVKKLGQVDDNTLRLTGFISMIVGVGLLLLINGTTK